MSYAGDHFKQLTIPNQRGGLEACPQKNLCSESIFMCVPCCYLMESLTVLLERLIFLNFLMQLMTSLRSNFRGNLPPILVLLPYQVVILFFRTSLFMQMILGSWHMKEATATSFKLYFLSSRIQQYTCMLFWYQADL